LSESSLDKSWTVTTIAGSNIVGTISDGTGSNANFNFLFSPPNKGNNQLVAVSKDDSFALVISGLRIRKVVISTGAVTTLAGSDTEGSSNGVGTNARFSSPYGIAISSTASWSLVGDGVSIRNISIVSGNVTQVSVTPYSGNNLALTPDDQYAFITSNSNCILRLVISTGETSVFTGNPGYGVHGPPNYFQGDFGGLSIAPSGDYMYLTNTGNFLDRVSTSSGSSGNIVIDNEIFYLTDSLTLGSDGNRMFVTGATLGFIAEYDFNTQNIFVLVGCDTNLVGHNYISTNSFGRVDGTGNDVRMSSNVAFSIGTNIGIMADFGYDGKGSIRTVKFASRSAQPTGLPTMLPTHSPSIELQCKL
jgi:hypothetical protein